MHASRSTTGVGRLLLAVALVACGGTDPDGPKQPTGPGTDTDTTDTDTTSDPTDGDDCLTDEEQFARDVSGVLQADCVACHQEGQVADATRNVLLPDTEPDHLTHNRAVLEPLALETADGFSLVVAKALGESNHGGGARLVLSDPGIAALQVFAARAADPGGCEDPVDDPLELDVPESPVRRLTPTQLERTVADLFPGVDVSGLVAVQSDPLVHGFDNNADTQTATALQVGQFHDAAFAVAAAAMADPTPWLGCDVADVPCVQGFLDAFGDRAFRRPITPEESDAYVGFYDEMLAEDGDPAAALQLTVQAFLESPSFLYLVEFGAADIATQGDRVSLTDHEVASRLSYFLWDTMPDEALFAAAAAGELSTSTGLEAQAWRMLEDDKAQQSVGNFHRLWLELDEVGHIAPDPATYPLWAGSYTVDLRDELDDLVQYSAFGPDPTLATLLLSRRTVVEDNGLAQLYGFVPDGSGVSELPATERAGVLTRMGWLGATSHPVFASPIQRGVFVLERLMCIPPPAPPADVDTDIPDDSELGPIVTNRDRYEQHSSDPACFGCHQSIDGIGFGFEHYDAIGAYRAIDNGESVDASGEFVDGDLSGIPYDGALEMSELLASSETVHRCAVTQWYRYAMGRSEQLGDQPTLDQLTDAYWGTGGELPQLLVDLVLTDSFRTRRAQ